MGKTMDLAMLGIIAIGGYYLVTNPTVLDNLFSSLKLPTPAAAAETPTPSDEESSDEEDKDKKDKDKDKDSKMARALHGISLYPHEDPSHLTGLFSDSNAFSLAVKTVSPLDRTSVSNAFRVNIGVIPKKIDRFNSLRGINIS